MTAAPPASPLVSRFVALLDDRGVVYCHWKSNNALDRSAQGLNDLDLLVSRSCADGFASALRECGFKEACAKPRLRLPGVLDFYGYDREIDRIIHAHVHYRLVIGHDYTKNYHLPIEEAFLASARPDGLFKTPSAEFDYVVFVIRMMIKHGTWEAPLVGREVLSSAESNELRFLEARIDKRRVREILRRHLPGLSPDLFARCARVLNCSPPRVERLEVGQQFVKSMEAYERRDRSVDIALKFWRRGYLSARWRVFRYRDRRRLGGGGAIIAVVGGDGSGKSTAVEGLHEWLAPVFETQTVHMGKPGWSASTIVVLGLLKAARVLHVLPHESRGGPVRGASVHDSLRFTDYVRRSLTARDRYLAYRRVRRGADEGSLVIADRFPLPQITLMDGGAGLTPGEGAGIASRWLAGMANSYYARMRSPEVLIVLRVDPGIAVRRKTEENEVSVRARTTEIWNLDWSGTHAQVVDASQSREDVLRIVKDRVWSSL